MVTNGESNYQTFIFSIVKNNNLTEQLHDNYFSHNFLLRYIFWKRVKIVLGLTEKIPKHAQVLDFGTGWGIMLPALSKTFTDVYAIDVDKRSLDLAEKIRQVLNCKNIHLQQVTPKRNLKLLPITVLAA